MAGTIQVEGGLGFIAPPTYGALRVLLDAALGAPPGRELDALNAIRIYEDGPFVPDLMVREEAVWWWDYDVLRGSPWALEILGRKGFYVSPEAYERACEACRRHACDVACLPECTCS